MHMNEHSKQARRIYNKCLKTQQIQPRDATRVKSILLSFPRLQLSHTVKLQYTVYGNEDIEIVLFFFFLNMSLLNKNF